MQSQPVRHVDYAQDVNRAWTANQTSASFASLPATTTPPTCGPTTGIYKTCPFIGANCPRWLFLMFFGAGADGNTYSVRVKGCKKVGDVYVWYTLAEFSLTLTATYTGVAGDSNLLDTDLLADTISLTTGNANVDVFTVSPADNTPGHALVDLKGCEYYAVQINKGTATSGNALIGTL